VTRKQQIGLAVFAALLVILFYIFFLILRPYLSYIIWGALLSIIVSPVNGRLRRRMSNDNLRAFIMSVMVVAVLIVPAVLLILGLVSEAAESYSMFRDAVQAGKLDFLLKPEAYGWNERLAEYLKPYVDISNIDIAGFIGDNLQRLTHFLAGKVSSVVSNISLAVVSFVFIIFSMFFFIRDGDKIAAYTGRLLPMSDDLRQRLAAHQREVIEASIYGGLLIAAVQGGLGTLIFWIMGIPSPLFWGVLMAFLSIVPFIGPWLIYIPAAVILVLTGSYIKGILLLVLGGAVVSQADNLLRPVIVGKRSRIPTLLLLFSILGGLKVFGLLGILLGPIIASMVLTLVNFYRDLAGESAGEAGPAASPPGQESA
jgi:predicted PurR-regulated permease PerM